MDAGSDRSSAAKLWSVALLCWLSFLHVLLPHLVYKVLHLCFTKGWFRGLRYVTWSTVLRQLFTCCSHAVHMHFTCWSHVGHMLLCLLVCPLCTPGDIVHQDSLCTCSRETMFPLMFIPCRHIVHISTSLPSHTCQYVCGPP